MGSLLVEAAGLMWGHVAVAGPGPGGGLGASRLPPWGAVGRGRQLRRVAPAAWGDFGVVRQRHALGVISCGFATWILRFCIPKVWMLRGSVFTRSLLGKTIQLRFLLSVFWVPWLGRWPILKGKQPRLGNRGPVRAYLRGCLHNSRYHVAEF